MRSTVVVGGGLAGLLSGVDRQRQGDDVLVLEAGDRPGGVAEVVERDGHRLPTAAATLRLPDPILNPILEYAGVETTPVAARGRFIADGELRPISPGAGLLPTDLVPARSKGRALLEPFLPATSGDDLTVSELMRDRFGAEVGDLAATLMTRGTFAGDPAQLSARAAFPQLSSRSVILGALQRRSSRKETRLPLGGIDGMIGRLASAMGELRLGTAVEKVNRLGNRWQVATESGTEVADRVILAVPPIVAASLLVEPGPVGQRWDPLPVVVVGLAGPKPEIRLPEGFGFLTGPGHQGPVLGCVFESDVDPSAAPPGRRLIRVMAGGALAPDLAQDDDDTILERVVSDLTWVTGIRFSYDMTFVVRQEPGIPQYLRGHAAWLRRIDDWLRDHPGLHLTGWGYRGVGVASLIDPTPPARRA